MHDSYRPLSPFQRRHSTSDLSTFLRPQRLKRSAQRSGSPNKRSSLSPRPKRIRSPRRPVTKSPQPRTPSPRSRAAVRCLRYEGTKLPQRRTPSPRPWWFHTLDFPVTKSPNRHLVKPRKRSPPHKGLWKQLAPWRTINDSIHSGYDALVNDSVLSNDKMSGNGDSAHTIGDPHEPHSPSPGTLPELTDHLYGLQNGPEDIGDRISQMRISNAPSESTHASGAQSLAPPQTVSPMMTERPQDCSRYDFVSPQQAVDAYLIIGNYLKQQIRYSYPLEEDIQGYTTTPSSLGPQTDESSWKTLTIHNNAGPQNDTQNTNGVDDRLGVVDNHNIQLGESWERCLCRCLQNEIQSIGLLPQSLGLLIVTWSFSQDSISHPVFWTMMLTLVTISIGTHGLHRP